MLFSERAWDYLCDVNKDWSASSCSFVVHQVSEKPGRERGGHEAPKHTHGNEEEEREESERHKRRGKTWSCILQAVIHYWLHRGDPAFIKKLKGGIFTFISVFKKILRINIKTYDMHLKEATPVFGPQMVKYGQRCQIGFDLKISDTCSSTANHIYILSNQLRNTILDEDYVGFIDQSNPLL